MLAQVFLQIFWSPSIPQQPLFLSQFPHMQGVGFFYLLCFLMPYPKDTLGKYFLSVNNTTKV
jgi:hypothetical protein